MPNNTNQALYALTPERHATVMHALSLHHNLLASHDDRRPITTAHGSVTPLGYADMDALIASLDNTGLEFKDMPKLFGTDESDPYVAHARTMVRDGELEVDLPTIVSEGADDGAYVMAWLWVSNEDAGVESEEADD